MSTRTELSALEAETLRLAALGYTEFSIAHRLSTTPDAVRNSLLRARRILGAQNTTHAAVKAAVAGLINVEEVA